MVNEDSYILSVRFSSAEGVALKRRAKLAGFKSVGAFVRDNLGLPPKPMGRPKLLKKTPKRRTPAPKRKPRS